MREKRKRRNKKEPYKAVCPGCGNIIPLNVREDWKQVEVTCPKCTTRFTLTRPEEIPQIERDFIAGDPYRGQGE